MGTAISEAVPAAVAVALVNPIAVIAVIVTLFSPRVTTAGAFVTGWVIGMAAVLGLLLYVASLDLAIESGRGQRPFTALIRLLLGLALLVLATRKWRGRPAAGEVVLAPGWMVRLEAAGPLAALGAGALLSSINPKNAPFHATAALAIAGAGLTAPGQAIPLVIYVLVASVGVATPVIWYAVARESAIATLTRWRAWLLANYATMMTVVFLLFAVKLLSQGLGGLIG
ncbi:MAG: GAP family protein [Thermomicrobiales bacterium]|nr:GAP family protein [Thermomicrobiales bacterium]